MTNDNCIFCKIGRKEEPNTVIEYESENIVIFKDIHPASDFHYLAIPKVHIRNGKSLTAEHIPLLEEMKEQLQILAQAKSPETPLSELTLGFHWPPFNSISHLHMHAITPVSKIRFMLRFFGTFKKGTFWYREADTVMASLRDAEHKN